MKKILVLALAFSLLFCGTVSAYSATDWWQANRRLPSNGETKELDEKDKTGSSNQSIIDWWYANRRSGFEPAKPNLLEPYPDYEDAKKDDGEQNEILPGIIKSEERFFFDIINEERQNRGISKLDYCSEVSSLARLKSQDMVDNNYFAHESPTYGRARDMLKEAGTLFNLSKENLARAGSVESAHLTLMSSSGHRSGILGERYTHVGIGVVETDRGGVMVTQIFIRK